MRISDWSSDVCSSDLAKGTPAPIEQFSAQRFAATGHRAQAVIPARLGFINGTHHLQRRRRQESVAHAEVLQKLEGALRRKLLEAMRNHSNTMVPCGQQYIEQAAYPCPVGRRDWKST